MTAPDVLHACPGADSEAEGYGWGFIDRAYCISLIERDDRARTAAEAFVRAGLASRVDFYRPRRHASDPVAGIWESHRAVARTALAAGHRTVAIFEDDIEFLPGFGPAALRRVAQAFARLPQGWQIFYLGHWPLRCRFIAPGLLQTSSGCTHAYVLSHDALKWLAATDFASWRASPLSGATVGVGIDGAYAASGRCYAVFPMVAIQSTSPADHIRAGKAGRVRKLKHLVTRTRAREWMLSNLMRPNEYLMAALALIPGLRDPIPSGRPGLGEGSLDFTPRTGLGAGDPP